MPQARKVSENWQLLERYWRRRCFHDIPIESVWAGRRRVVIRLQTYTLVVTNVTKLTRCELPAIWLYDSLKPTASGCVLDVETDTGHLIVSGADVRLLTIDDVGDCRILIPPIDS